MFPNNQSHGDTTGDLENFTRHNPKRRAVNTLPSIDSHGHLKCELCLAMFLLYTSLTFAMA